MLVNEGFQPKRKANDRLPPGQYETKGFPVLAFGPTPHIDKKEWRLEVSGKVGKKLSWSWDEFIKLPAVDLTADIHCVTKWSKFDSKWRGVTLDTIMELVRPDASVTDLVAHSYDGYTTNLPLEDIKNGQAMVATEYDGSDIEAEHGGPARLLVPHLYFWKSAKWLKGLEFIDHDEPGFWETRGYHNYGDPWKEQRYSFD